MEDKGALKYSCPTSGLTESGTVSCLKGALIQDMDYIDTHYANSAVYACPTDRASFGITLLEAMACRTPVVCSDIAGFRDVVRHDREALMFPAGDVRALSDSLVQVLEDDVLRERLGTAGREHAFQYSWPSVTSRVRAPPPDYRTWGGSKYRL